MGEVRGWDLHFVDFIQVCLCSAEWVSAERLSDVAILSDGFNDYSRNESVTSGWKALLLNKVVVGKGMKLTQDDITLIQPPPGHDSVSILGQFLAAVLTGS